MKNEVCKMIDEIAKTMTEPKRAMLHKLATDVMNSEDPRTLKTLHSMLSKMVEVAKRHEGSIPKSEFEEFFSNAPAGAVLDELKARYQTEGKEKEDTASYDKTLTKEKSAIEDEMLGMVNLMLKKTHDRDMDFVLCVTDKKAEGGRMLTNCRDSRAGLILAATLDSLVTGTAKSADLKGKDGKKLKVCHLVIDANTSPEEIFDSLPEDMPFNQKIHALAKVAQAVVDRDKGESVSEMQIDVSEEKGDVSVH